MSRSVTQCSRPDCSSPATAKGLCAKHYMRLRRHGDASRALKAGRKPDLWAAKVRMSFDGISARSLGRYMHAIRLLRTHELDFAMYINRATRANGSLNMARLEDMAETAVAFRFLDEHPELLEQDDEGD